MAAQSQRRLQASVARRRHYAERPEHERTSGSASGWDGTGRQDLRRAPAPDGCPPGADPGVPTRPHAWSPAYNFRLARMSARVHAVDQPLPPGFLPILSRWRRWTPSANARPMKLLGCPVGLDQPLFLIAGPCVVESEELQLRTAERLKDITGRLGIQFIFKSSFDKANRSSDQSYRGPGIEEGLRILAKVRAEIGVAVLTDIHDIPQIAAVAEVVDVLQTPAFLARQTDFIHAVAASGKPVNIKKGQFMAPADMKNVVDKARSAALAAGVEDETIMVCERGASFGYNNLVSDMRSLSIMRETGCPVVFDATHSVQLPGGQGTSSGGQREFVPVLARAAVATGVAGVFMETHPNPEKALSDGPNAWPLNKMKALLETLKALDELVKSRGLAESELLAQRGR